MQDLLSCFQNHLRNRKLLQRKDRVLVAVSGGPDSTALLDLLSKSSSDLKLKLTIAHFNHQLRGKQSAQDAVFVKKLSLKYKIPFVLGKGNVRSFALKEKFSTEEAARFQRYDFLNQTAKRLKVNRIVTAHTLDDQAETVWMRVLQGTGLRGLCGIRESMNRGKVRIIRPLLGFSKKEILEYLKSKKIPYRKDASNQSLDILRNRIRLKLIPFLEKNFHPKIREAAARIPEILSGESEALESVEREIWPRIHKIKKKKKELTLHAELFLSQAAAIQFRLLNRGLKTLDSKSGLSFEAWQNIQPLLSQKRFRRSLPRDIDFEITPSAVRLYKK